MKIKFRSTHVAIAMIAASGFSLAAFQQKPKFDLKASIARGKEVYTTQCITCHMEQGEGLEGVYPPLAKSDYMMADKKRSIQQIVHGVSGEIKVNGVTYSGDMPAVELTDEQVSDVLNYVRNSWGNKGSDAVKPEEVKAAR
ncbi:MAG TPA: c-type cytochrome [Ohtaekwangia sp.]|uniref:c-type cytochrome n=1 Tax=Ohtaekwangia sp. TaxID=2066019 RepID=UPI002F921EC5